MFASRLLRLACLISFSSLTWATDHIVLGSYSEPARAQLALAETRKQTQLSLQVIATNTGSRTLYRLVAGPFTDTGEADRRLSTVRRDFADAWVLRGATQKPGATTVMTAAPKPIQANAVKPVSEPTQPAATQSTITETEQAPPSAPAETRTVVLDSRKKKARAPSGWVPPGFEDLLEPQTTEVDVHFGGRFLASTMATYTPSEITLLAPEEILVHLADVLDPQSVLAMLTGPMPANAELVCLYQNQTECGTLETDSVEVIFDESRFRLDVFIGRQLMAIREAGIDKFLPPSSGGPAFLNQLNAAMNGSEGGRSLYNIGNSTTLSYRETRLLAISNFTRAEDFSVDTLALEREINGQLYQAGYFRSSAANLRFLTEREFAGITMSSSLDTRNDLDQSTGNDLQVFLDTRSRVDLLKDGRLISTAVYDAGNQIIDTSSLPGGAYDVLLRIRDSFGRTRNEVRFYAKTNLLPPADQTLFFLDIGEVAVREIDETLPQTTGESLVRAGLSRRLTSNFGAQLGVMALEDEQLVELGLFQLGRTYDLNLNLAAGSKNDRGVSIGARFRWNLITLNIDARKTWVDENRFDLSLLSNEVTQGSMNLSIPFARGTLAVTGRYNKRGLREADENYGLRYDFASYAVGRSSLNTDLQITRDNGDLQALLTFRLRLDQGNWRHEASSQYYYEDTTGFETEDGFINNLSTAWSDGDRYRSDMNWNLRAVDERQDQSLETDFEIVSDYGRMNADLIYSNQTDNLSWGGSLHTNIIANSNTISFGGREQARSALVMNVEGDVKDAYFDVLINGSPRGTASIGGKTVLGIQPFETYKVTLMPAGNSIIDFNNQVQTATLYPGNVITMDWKVSRVVVSFGQLIAADGTPISNALISGVTGIATTDEFGYFQAEIESTTRSVGAKTRTSECTAALPEFDGDQMVVMFDAVVCR